MQTELIKQEKRETSSLSKYYSRGPYNKTNEKEQWIRISEGCPNKCAYCRESFECGTEPIYFNIPKIIRNEVKIMDMNLIYKPKAKEIIETLGKERVNGKVVYYELICGIDYRYLTQDLANALKVNRFKKIRIAWDWSFSRQYYIQKAIKMLLKAGYRPSDLQIFMICNWKISYQENLKKLDSCKVWNVQVSDCYFDNQLPPKVLPIFWTIEQILDFRKKVRTHNILIRHNGVNPEE